MKEQIYEIVARILEIDITDINEGISMETTETWDSLAHLMIIGEIEEKLNVQIPIDKVLEICTVKDLLEITRG